MSGGTGLVVRGGGRSPNALIRLLPGGPYDLAVEFDKLSAPIIYMPRQDRWYRLSQPGALWTELSVAQIRVEIWSMAHRCEVPNRDGDWKPLVARGPFISDAIDALKAVVDRLDTAPATYAGSPLHLDREIVVVDGLLNLGEPNPHLRRRVWPADLFAVRSTPVPYDPAATCPTVDAALVKMLGDPKVGADKVETYDAEQIETWWEMWAWVAFHVRPALQRIFLLIGAPGTGKSSLVEAVDYALGGVMATTSLDRLGARFGLGEIVRREPHLIHVAEARVSLRADQAAILNVLLQLSGGEDVEHERKNRDTESGRLALPILISSNEVPGIGDRASALRRRLIALQGPMQEPTEEPDRGLVAKMKLEAAGILNRIAEGACRLAARGDFRQPAQGLGIVQEMVTLGAPIKSAMVEFIDDYLIIDPAGEVSRDYVFVLWQGHCDSAELHRTTKASFGRDLKNIVTTVGEKRGARDATGRRPRLYTGIRLANVATHAAVTGILHESFNKGGAATGNVSVCASAGGIADDAPGSGDGDDPATGTVGGDEAVTPTACGDGTTGAGTG